MTLLDELRVDELRELGQRRLDATLGLIVLHAEALPRTTALTNSRLRGRARSA
jgi:hypothetical protein